MDQRAVEGGEERAPDGEVAAKDGRTLLDSGNASQQSFSLLNTEIRALCL